MFAVAVTVMCAAIPVTEAAAKSFGSRPLARPMKGADVRELQRLLTAWGLPLQMDGVFGRMTTRSVRSWERYSGRRVNGRVSRRDARALQLAVSRGERKPGSEVDATEAAPAAPGETATLAPDGTAIAPASAPPEVQAIIAAGNEIHDFLYKYGGGHAKWDDTGYDCSGSVSYALHGAGLLSKPLDSTAFMRWGEAGAGEWVTIYTNPGHAYMLVAGLRFDTSGRAQDGSRWHTSMRSASGYTARHPEGL
jgi:cell wall-associated NlpC family hydrolase